MCGKRNNTISNKNKSSNKNRIRQVAPEQKINMPSAIRTDPQSIDGHLEAGLFNLVVSHIKNQKKPGTL